MSSTNSSNGRIGARRADCCPRLLRVFVGSWIVVAATVAVALAQQESGARPDSDTSADGPALENAVPAAASDRGAPGSDGDEQSAPEETEPVSQSSAPPWDGSLGAGLAELAARAESGDSAGALEVAERLLSPDRAARARTWLERWTGGTSERLLAPLERPLAALGLDPLMPSDRAEVHFAVGVVHTLDALRTAESTGPGTEPDFAPAREALGRARELGGAARMDAVYDLGWLVLHEAEGLRARIPEISGEQGHAGHAPSGQGPAGQVPSGPGHGVPGPQDPAAKDDRDPLELARAAYLEARDHFVERLQLDWRDADTRANVELIQRRLRELDEIEREREKQKQDQEQQPDSEPKDGEGQQQEGQPKEGDQEQDPTEGSEGEQQPGEEEQQPEEEPSEEEGEPEEPEPSEEDQGDENSEEAVEESAQELHLTEEEAKRLMEQLRQYQEHGEEVRRVRRAVRRRPSERDW